MEENTVIPEDFADFHQRKLHHARDQTLTISAERKSDREDKQGELLLNERRYSRFVRSFTLPPTVNEQTVNARLADGVLTITLNKREETKPRKITVS